MFAQGLPDKRVKSKFPTLIDKKLNYVIQIHQADKAGRHFDFRISDGTTAYSWATRKGLPPVGGKHLFIRQPDHTPEYMNFRGLILDGYGKGKVSTKEKGIIHILESKSSSIKFVIYAGIKINRYTLVDIGNDNWLCTNTTPTKYNRPMIPKKKPKAKEIRPGHLDLSNSSTILMPKIDGSASVFLLQKNRPVEVFSYRRSKRGPELINRTYKYPSLYNTKVPASLDKTVLWGESFVTDSSDKSLPHRESVGLLNASTPKAMKTINEKNYKFDNVIFNVNTFNNKKVENLPYLEKLRMLRKINSEIPALKLPEIAVTSHDKKRLYNAIKDKRYPKTTEGYVEWDLTSSRPTKAKIKSDTELYVQDFEEGRGKYIGTLGKIVGTPDPEGYGPRTRVGGGFTDSERNDIWKDKNKYLKLPMKVEYQEKMPSGKLRMPIFKSFRIGEFWDTEKIAYDVSYNKVKKILEKIKPEKVNKFKKIVNKRYESASREAKRVALTSPGTDTPYLWKSHYWGELRKGLSQ